MRKHSEMLHIAQIPPVFHRKTRTKRGRIPVVIHRYRDITRNHRGNMGIFNPKSTWSAL